MTAPGAGVEEALGPPAPVPVMEDDGPPPPPAEAEPEPEAAAWRAEAWVARNLARITVSSVRVSIASGESVGGMWVAIFMGGGV